MSRKLLVRTLVFLICANVLGFGFHFTQRSLQKSRGPAGFALGVLHGAFMPLALPSLLFGGNVEIYATNNTGRSYKMGYSAGVNGCGLIFFGFFFRRLSRWRKKPPAGTE